MQEVLCVSTEECLGDLTEIADKIWEAREPKINEENSSQIELIIVSLKAVVHDLVRVGEAISATSIGHLIQAAPNRSAKKLRSSHR
ncbi:unnamed protein product [Fasciola hepatica]|uniref:Uncharacterized protein n=1 Tax=Fasciola hepatica TaxID=6192 RepID=A0ABC9HHS7_FASHE